MMDRGLLFLGIGFELVAMCVGGYFLGRQIDEYMGWNSRASVFLVLILLIGWFVHLFYLIRKFEQDEDPKTGPGPHS